MELLRDPIWQFAGAILTVFAILVSLAIYFAQRSRRIVSVEVLRNGRILTIQEESVGKLQLMFDGKLIHNTRLIEVCVTNSGNQPIKPADFIKSLTFSFNAEAEVLSTATVGTVPKDLTAELLVQSNEVVLAPLLLNPRDSITIRFLVSKYTAGPTHSARINGVSKITEIRESPRVILFWIGISYALIGTSIFISPKRLEIATLTERVLSQLPSLILLFLALTVLTVVSIQTYRRVKRRG
jgi:hypothetical protein